MFQQRSPWAAFQSFMTQLGNQQNAPQIGAIDTGGIPPNAIPPTTPWNNTPASPIATPQTADYYGQAMANYGRPMADNGMNNIDPRKFERPQGALQAAVRGQAESVYNAAGNPMAGISQGVAGYRSRESARNSTSKRLDRNNWEFS